MPEVISDTTPLQYLHQTGLLGTLQRLYGQIVVPEAVCRELAVGRQRGIDVPDPDEIAWMSVRRPKRALADIGDTRLGEGESQTLALGTESRIALLLLDDKAARRCARLIGLAYTGTLGILVKARKAGFVGALLPIVNQLRGIGFHMDPHIRSAILRMAGEGGGA